MPFANEHSCRLKSPGQYDSFRRQNNAGAVNGKRIDFIFGIKNGKSERQAIRYPRGQWDASDARSHCNSEDGIRFEPATNESAATMTERRKNLQFKIKDEDQGLVTAVFSRFNVMDHDGDVTVPGAFTEGAQVPIGAYGHTSFQGALPVGKGTIRQTDSEAILDGQFFLDTSAGKDTFEVIKQLGSLQEWSYGFSVESVSFREFNGNEDVPHLEALEVHEISPVLKGAGIDTVTVDAKAQTKDLALEEKLEDFFEDLRKLKEGRELSARNRERLGEISGSLRESANGLDEMLRQTAPPEQNSGLENVELAVQFHETLLERF